MTKWILPISMLLTPLLQAAPPSERQALPPLATQAQLQLPAMDAAKVRAQDVRVDRAPGAPMRYALGHAVDRTIATPTARRSTSAMPQRAPAAAPGAAPVVTGTLGEWTPLSDGTELWRLKVHAPGAVSLDFGFDSFRLPHGAELWVVGQGKGNRVGPFTDAHNRSDGGFWTPRVLGDTAELQLSVPAAKRGFLALSLATVHQGYRDLRALQWEQKSGSCNVDVACPEGAQWQDQAASVAALSFSADGSRDGNFCSGQFVRHTGSGGPFLLLGANHCGIHPGNDHTVVAYLHFENSTCRTPGSAASGQPGNGSLQDYLTGASVLAQSDAAAAADGQPVPVIGSDFMLLGFDAVPSGSGVFFSGWDRRDLVPAGGVGIHHPRGDEKRISFDDDPLQVTDYLDGPGSGTTHLRVVDWDLGTTEPSSSGSGLWNSDGRLVGWLSGGFAACGNDESDWYGRLAFGWNESSQPGQRLRDWLDPAGSGVQLLDGAGACQAPQVQLSAPAFTQPPVAGAQFTLTASASGGTGSGYQFHWDLDGDGVVDRSGTQTQVRLSFPTATSTQVRVSVSDSSGCSGSASRALDVAGPRLQASAQPLQQLCGNGDSRVEPGERWRLPVRLQNTGNAPLLADSRALFVPGDGRSALGIGPDAHGYAATTSNEGQCAASFIDLAAGQYAVPQLALTDAGISGSLGARDDGRSAEPIALAAGVRVYGQPVSQAIMSTNGYLSFSDQESGGDFFNDCVGSVGNGSTRPRLHVMHDDLVAGATGTAGLRHRAFATCPRPADTDGPTPGCHVFQWDGMQLWDGGTPSGNYSFQAVLYQHSGQIVYQYRSAAAAEATIGLVAATPAAGLLNVLAPGSDCDDAGFLPQANSAVCVFDPAASPASAGVRIETPAPLVPTLAIGASATVPVDFQVPADASCGAPLSIHLRGAANGQQSAPEAAALLDLRLGQASGQPPGQQCAVANCPAQVPDIDARSGLFYSAARPGNGLLHFTYGSPADRGYGGLFYTALPDRTPTWYTVQGPYSDHLAVAQLRAFTNTDAPDGFAPEGMVVGNVWIAQPRRDELLMAWEFHDGRRGIEQLQSSGLPFATPNRTQLWYPPQQSGWGMGVESTGSGAAFNEFWAVFLFDDAGVGRWVVGSSGQRDGSMPMIGYQVHCPGCPFLADQLERPQAAGSIARSYAGLAEALLDADITLPAPMTGSWQRDDLPIAPLGPIEQP